MKGGLLRWGICCAGMISSDFVCCIGTLDPSKHVIHAIAASTLQRAQEFAEKHGIQKQYGSYEELANDPEVDVVYIGSIHTQHYSQTKMMLESGKPVICEKPLCLHPNQVKELYKLAKSKNLFCMEGVWSRFFPVYKMLNSAIENGDIGEIKFLQCFLGDFVPQTVPVWQRLSQKESGGGAINDLGVYPFQLAQFLFKDKPDCQETNGFVNESEVDIMSTVTLKYSNDRMASLGTAINCNFSNNAVIGGTKGIITIHKPFWCPTKITINGVDHSFELPKTSKTMIFRNSTGLAYEAEEIYNCIKHGLLESPLYTHEASIIISEMLYKSRRDLGYVLPIDEKWDA